MIIPIWVISEWVRHLEIYSMPISAVTTVGAFYFLIALYKILSSVKNIRNLRNGLLAEKVVGQYLEQFRMLGYQIFHDVPGQSGDQKFNLDHVIIGPKGIFTIETKYARKRNGQSKIYYNGTDISIDGYKPERNPVTQAKAQRSWLADNLKRGTGKNYSIRPVVVYPGWWIENKASGADEWVLNEKALPAFTKNSSGTLSTLDIHAASDHLSRYIQSTLS